MTILVMQYCSTSNGHIAGKCTQLGKCLHSCYNLPSTHISSDAAHAINLLACYS